MILRSIQYDFFQAVYLLIAVFIIAWLFSLLFTYRKNALAQFSPEAKQHILIERNPWLFWSKVLLVCLAWGFAVFALTQPKGNEHYAADPRGKKTSDQKQIAKRKLHEVIFLVDASASMSGKDTPGGITRLDYAKEIADEIVSRLRGENASLFAFTSIALQMSPSTLDYLFVRLMLRQIQINEGETAGTSLLAALSDVRKQYFAVATPRLKTLIILSDGDDTYVGSLQGEARQNAIESIANLVEDANTQNLRVFAVGIGSKQGIQVPGVSFDGKPVISSLNEELMQKISSAGKGVYYNANALTSLQISDDILEKMIEGRPQFEEDAATKAAYEKKPLLYELFFQMPLGFAIAFLIFFLLLPDVYHFGEESK